ncbi:hypothetical protein GUJ93_ZPchr0009g1589 [Zizania palustris]|uniref:Uncharacterized protein n=1 Tax=Zizania palustris TaxID=103762 RepID=A0A8J5S2V2_ZIZPA|nr:hypothetical protein GUJ93_ZPchr0009g1589 [Zizania palustris]
MSMAEATRRQRPTKASTRITVSVMAPQEPPKFLSSFAREASAESETSGVTPVVGGTTALSSSISTLSPPSPMRPPLPPPILPIEYPGVGPSLWTKRRIFRRLGCPTSLTLPDLGLVGGTTSDAPSETDIEIHRAIANNKKVVESMERILNCKKCTAVDKIHMLAIKILTQPTIDALSNEDIDTLITNLLVTFLTTHENKDNI